MNSGKISLFMKYLMNWILKRTI